jgi:hypothetical protein
MNYPINRENLATYYDDYYAALEEAND